MKQDEGRRLEARSQDDDEYQTVNSEAEAIIELKDW